MHTDEHPCRSPAAIVSLRPVTLRPYLSTSLPSECRLLGRTATVNLYWDEWLSYSDDRQRWLK